MITNTSGATEFRTWLRAGIDECEEQLGHLPAGDWETAKGHYLVNREKMLGEAMSALMEWDSMPTPIRPG